MYWLIQFDDGTYTLLQEDSKYCNDERLDQIKPIVEAQIDTGSYINLEVEQIERQSRALARKLLITCTMLGNGQATINDAMNAAVNNGLSDSITADGLLAASSELTELGIFSLIENNRIAFDPVITTDASIRRQLFHEWGRDSFITLAVGCEWWDAHVDESLMLEACKIQGELNLGEENQRIAIEIMRLSPTAMLRAIHADPMIAGHRSELKTIPNNDQIDEHDRNHFMRNLHNGLVSDFRNKHLAAYFYSRRRIKAIKTTTRLLVCNRDDVALIEDQASESTMIGEWHEKAADGTDQYVLISPLNGYFDSIKPPCDSLDAE